MLKKFSKFLLLTLTILLTMSSFFMCFAHEDHDHNNTTNTTTESTENNATGTDQNTSTDPETHTGDLYLFDNNIVMDKYVDGNVFLFGNNIEITGRVNGNLFVFGNNVKFDESIVRYSVFVCANSVYYNGGCGTQSDYGNLYVAAKKFESTYNSFVTGDVKAISSNVILKSAIYRDVDLISTTVNFGEGEDIPIIYGNLNYTAFNKVSIPEGVLGTTESSVNYSSSYNMVDILIGLGTSIVTALSLYVILNKLTPKFIEKVCNNKFSVISLLKAFGIGLATIAVVSIFIILLAGTQVGLLLAILLALLFTVFYIIAVPTLTIKIANSLKPALKIEKTALFYLIIVLASSVLYGITLIPFVGGLLSLITNVTALGLIVNIYLPNKELTDEEKLAIEESNKLAKENKEKNKQEKLEKKAAKKEKKSKVKETKKKDKEI